MSLLAMCVSTIETLFSPLDKCIWNPSKGQPWMNTTCALEGGAQSWSSTMVLQLTKFYDNFCLQWLGGSNYCSNDET
eukprot:10857186-Ditylum_brightwellii.AAC.1